MSGTLALAPGTARRATIALLWVPCAVAVLLRLAWPDAPATVPTHWDASLTADGFSNGTAVWAVLLAVAAVSAGMATATVLVGSGPAPRRSAVVGSLITSAATISWPVFSLCALAADGRLLGPESALYLLVPAWAALVYAVTGSMPTRRASP